MRILFVTAVLLLATLLAGCGEGSDSSKTGSGYARHKPTMGDSIEACTAADQAAYHLVACARAGVDAAT